MWVTIKKYAELMKVSERHVRKLVEARKLEVIDLSLDSRRHCWRIHYKD